MSTYPNKTSYNIRWLAALAALLAVSGVVPARGQSGEADFETFIMPSPDAGTQAASQAALEKSEETVTLPPRHLSPEANHLRTEIDVRIFPGDNDLGVNLTGRWSGQEVASQVSPLRWLHGDWMNSGYFQATGGQQGARQGESTSDLLGNVQGLRLFTTPAKNGQGTVGLGLYQRLGQSQPGFNLAADSQWQVSREEQIGLLLAAASSWRLTQQSHNSRWQMSSFLGHDARSRGMEGGLLLEANPTRSLSLYNRMSAWSGSQPGQSWAAGITQWLGAGFLALNQSRQRLGSDQLRQTSASFFLPMRRDSMTLRWEGDTSEQPSDSGTAYERSQSLFATYASSPRGNTSVWADGGAYWQNGGRRQTLITLGGSRVIDAHWELQASLTQRLDDGSRQIRTALGYRLNPNQEVKLLFGPSSLVGPAGQTRQALGFEIVQRFDVADAPAGEISGQVLLDGKPCPQRLLFRLDDGNTAATDAQGQFHFRHVAPGPCLLQMSLADLPASLSAETSSCQVEVKPQKTSRVTFSVRRVGQVQGVVRVAADAFGQTDCTAGIGITIAAGEIATTTNGESAFLLGGLPLGKCRLTLVAGTIPPDFQIVGPDHVDIDVVPNQPIPPIEFKIAPHTQKIDFNVQASSHASR